MKYLIVGGVAGGASAAARLRRLDEKAEIILFERGKYVSYANCGLPYYIGETIRERDHLFVQTVEGFVNRFRIDIRTEQEVQRILPDVQQIEVRRSDGSTYIETYDKLLLSPGAEPLRPRIEGIDDKRIMTLRNVADTDAIYSFIAQNKPRHAAVIGGGFIGLEMAENLHQRGIQVSVIEMADQVMAPLDYTMASMVHQHLCQKGINLLLKNGVQRFESTTDEQVGITLADGQLLKADLVILSIGVRPENKLAREAGLTLGERGGIVVNEYLQTSDPNIYAVGDAIEIRHLVTNLPAMIPLAGPANKQGRIAADNMNGAQRTYRGTQGTSIAKVFDLTVAAAGANAKLLRHANIPYQSTIVHGGSHAGYYPGSTPLTIKILFSPKGQLLGAQVVGFDGVDKRIEMLAQVIGNHGSIYDLTELEHAYAPPFASAKDPVNMAGYVAENILTGKVETISWRDIATLSPDTQCIDVRTPDEYELGSIPGFRNIPVDNLREELATLNPQHPVVVTCAVGLRGYLAARILLQNGFTHVRNLSGGYKVWQTATAPITVQPFSASSTPQPQQATTPAIGESLQINACGLMCPGPILKLKQHYADLAEGETLQITATDQAFARDVQSWCNMTGANLLNIENQQGQVRATISKQAPVQSPASASPAERHDNQTIVVFSDDLDKALASFVIANGAAAAGKKVTLFFTFWGLNVIKKRSKPAVQKDIFGRMFGWMLPKHSGQLALSKLNMLGIGSRMMRHLMQQKQIDSLESLMAQAQGNGVEMIACTMSMDVMGITREELMDHVELGGVATYLERADHANKNLFI